MYDLIAHYWWVLIFSVPALAIAIKFTVERIGLVDSLSAPLQRKLSTLEHSYSGHWVVTATIRDGRRFSHVVINDRFQLVSDAALLFQLRHVEDVAWEGFTGPPEDPVAQLSEGRSNPGSWMRSSREISNRDFARSDAVEPPWRSCSWSFRPHSWLISAVRGTGSAATYSSSPG